MKDTFKNIAVAIGLVLLIIVPIQLAITSQALWSCFVVWALMDMAYKYANPDNDNKK